MSNFHPTGQCKFWWSKKLHKSILRTCLQKKKKLWVEEKFWFPKNSYVAKNNHYKQTIHICQQFLSCRKTITSAKYIEVHFNSFLGQNKIILLFGVKKQNGSTMQITMFWEGCKLLVKAQNLFWVWKLKFAIKPLIQSLAPTIPDICRFFYMNKIFGE